MSRQNPARIWLVAFISLLIFHPLAWSEVKQATAATTDGVSLALTEYWPAKPADKVPVVVLIPPMGQTQDALVGLAQDIAKKSPADAKPLIVTFDFRGYGKSTSVDAAKFVLPTGKPLPAFAKGELMGKRYYKGIKTIAPWMSLDLLAVKAHLKALPKVEIQQLVYLALGPETGETLCYFLAKHEFVRPAAFDPIPYDPAGVVFVDPPTASPYFKGYQLFDAGLDINKRPALLMIAKHPTGKPLAMQDLPNGFDLKRLHFAPALAPKKGDRENSGWMSLEFGPKQLAGAKSLDLISPVATFNLELPKAEGAKKPGAKKMGVQDGLVGWMIGRAKGR